MARYTGPVCKLCRREDTKLFLKGEKCYSGKCPYSSPKQGKSTNSRGVPKAKVPGPHGDRRKKLTEYGVQLREKQKVKRFYGVLEKQFVNYFEMAEKRTGVTGDNLLRILESRLDNIVCRMGFALSRAEARQLVTHGHITVNGKPVNIPSYLVSEGDVIAIKAKSKDSTKIKAVAEITGAKPIARWLEVDKENMTGTVVAIPEASEVDDMPIEVHLIVELYSK